MPPPAALPSCRLPRRLRTPPPRTAPGRWPAHSCGARTSSARLPAMTVDEAWDGIEDWLRANAPGSHSGLPPPAAPGKIQAAQDTTGCAFPAELAASLARHDGSGEFLLPPLHRLHGTRLIVAEYRAYRRAEQERSPGSTPGGTRAGYRSPTTDAETASLSARRPGLRSAGSETTPRTAADRSPRMGRRRRSGRSLSRRPRVSMTVTGMSTSRTSTTTASWTGASRTRTSSWPGTCRR